MSSSNDHEHGDDEETGEASTTPPPTTSSSTSTSTSHHEEWQVVNESTSLLDSINVVNEEQTPTTIAQRVLRRVDTIVETTEAVQDALVEELQIVQQGLMEELHEAAGGNDGDDFFLQMTLTRNLSILPTDKSLNDAADGFNELVRTLSLVRGGGGEQCLPAAESSDSDHTAETAPDDSDEEQTFLVGTTKASTTAPKSKTTIKDKPSNDSDHPPLSAYFLLATAVLALSSIGPFLNYQKGVEPCMKIVWRMSGTSMLLAPFALRSLLSDGIPDLSGTQWCTFAFAAANYAVMCVFFVLALDYTSVDNAVILANSQSLILLVGKLFVGASIHWLEGSGALVAFAGAVMCSRDHSATVVDDQDEDTGIGWKSTLWGDCLAMISAVGGVFYIVFGKAIRTVIGDVYVFMFLNMTIGSILTLLFMVVIGQDVSFSRDMNDGVWGWMNLRTDRLPLEIAMVVVCNFMGSLGYVRAFKYFSSLIISVAALMEPVVASFLAFEMGVGALPGAVGWIGNALVAAGTVAVVYPTAEKDEAH